MAVLFAVGAVSGTVLSFEMGLLWPGLTGIYGDVYGLPFSVEGIFFFLEAIFITIYIYGWKHLSPWTHFWLGDVLPFVALGGVFSIISANGWMNAPAGFTLGADGRPTNMDPIAAIFNSGGGVRVPAHAGGGVHDRGFLIAGVFAVAQLRGHWGRYQRLAFAIPFTVAAIVAPLQMMIGDTVARTVFQEMPVKFAAIEIVWTTGPDQPEIILGRLNQDTGVDRRRPADSGHGLVAVGIQHLDGHHRAEHRAARATSRQPTSCTGPGTGWSSAGPAWRCWPRGSCCTGSFRRRSAGHRVVLPLRGRGGDPVGVLHRVRLDRHRGRAAAMDRLQLPADGRRGHQRGHRPRRCWPSSWSST